MPVHNHGFEEGAGLSCNELRLPDGSIKGRCLMENVVVVSADLSRRVAEADRTGQFAKVQDLKHSWAEWRDTLSPEDKERCVWAFVAAQSVISAEALILLKEQKPEVYQVYREVKGF